MAMRLTDEQLDWLAARVPDAPVFAKGGRPAMDKRLALQGIFWILDNGAKWQDLPKRFGSNSSVHRWFTTWTKAGVFERIMRDAGRQGGTTLLAVWDLERVPPSPQSR